MTHPLNDDTILDLRFLDIEKSGLILGRNCMPVLIPQFRKQLKMKKQMAERYVTLFV
jgi:hypothetical protein